MFEIQSLVNFYELYGYIAVFGVLILCGFGLPVPEDISLVAGGIISGLGYTDVHLMTAIAMAGVLIGDSTVYNLGRIFGERFLRLKFVARILTPERYAVVKRRFDRHGRWVIFAARFMPGLRTPIFATAGITRFVSFPQFIAIDGFAALISVPFWVYLGYFGAHERDVLIRWITRSQFGALALVLVVVAAVLISAYVRRRIKATAGLNGNGNNGAADQPVDK